jgi:hypothetical protein
MVNTLDTSEEEYSEKMCISDALVQQEEMIDMQGFSENLSDINNRGGNTDHRVTGVMEKNPQPDSPALRVDKDKKIIDLATRLSKKKPHNSLPAY